jgi:hypothetical protein
VGWDLTPEENTPVLVSDDGLNWESILVAELSRPEQVISFGESFMLFDSSNSSVWTSDDGEGWLAKTSPGPVTRLLTTDLGVFASASLPEGEQVIAAGRSDGYVSISDDLGETWSDEALPLSEISVDRLYTNGYLIGVGHSDSCFGEDPSCRKDFYLVRQQALFWSHSEIKDQTYWHITALLADGIEVSTDGRRLAHRGGPAMDWELVPEGENTEARFSEIVFGNSTFVAAGEGGLRYSDDGKEWHRYDSIASE